MFSSALHRHREAAIAGLPPPVFGAETPASIVQRAQAAIAACQVPKFRTVLNAEFAKMQMAVARHDRERSAVMPDSGKAAALLVELRAGLGFMQAVVALGYDERQTCWTAFDGIPLSDEQRAVFDRYPALAAWRANWEAQAADIDRRNAEQNSLLSRERRNARPAVLVAELQARGVKLEVDRAGHITALPGEAVTAEEIAEIKEFKAAIVALLTAPEPPAASPARPLVLA